MDQEMDANLILEMSSDIDEIEKEKAIKSIVLDTSVANSYEDDFNETDDVVDVNSSTNITNSLYDADESMKSTDAENGNETSEIKEKELHPLDGEDSTSIAVEPCAQSTSPPAAMSSPVIVANPVSDANVSSSSTITATATAPAPAPAPTPTTTALPNTSPSKILYVKLVPKTSVPTAVTTTPPQSPPKSITISTLKNKHEKTFDANETKKPSPLRMSVEEPTTSNICGVGTMAKSVGHTVNLLNNNRILIKSVKNNHTISTSIALTAATTKSTINSGSSVTITAAISPQLQAKKREDKRYQAIETSEITSQSASNVTHNAETIQTNDEKETKRTTEIDDKETSAHEMDVKTEEALNANSSENAVDDDDDNNKLCDTPNDDKLSAHKIKREFEQLQKTVNESKVLSEFVIEHNKRNRRPTKSGKSKHKHNHSVEISSPVDEKLSIALMNARSVSPSSSSVRSASKESDRSASSSFTGSAGAKRNTRSMNTDFSAKQKQFLKGIQQITRGTDDETDNNSGVDDDDNDLDYYAKHQPNIIERRKSVAAKQAFSVETKNNGWDKYCWRCHQPDSNMFCSCCIKSYHANCLKMKLLTPSEMGKWQCPECIDIKAAEKENKKKKFDVKHFNKLLKYAMNRILQDPNLQQFQFPVSKTTNPGYSDVIINPINLSRIENKIDNLEYTNSEAFLSDIKWILHNCSIYFSDNKITRAAKSLQKVSKQEVGDIETCPECYLNANTMTDNWFTETCVSPHLILWAKLKGFPYWPAKAMSINSTLVDVRFFGEHDRANIPAKDCFLYSREDPNPPTNKYKRNTIADCVKEVDIYIENIIAKYGAFKYADLKTPFNPQLAEQHLHDMIPGLKSARGRRRSSTARSDLTLKIVKTADNNLSVVKKDQTTKELPQIKRTVDITGEEAVSRTPTPPSAVLSRRKTSDTRIKRSKSTNRHSEGKITTLDHKSYQVMRRKSMAVEKLDQKRMNALHAVAASATAALEINKSVDLPEVSLIRYNSKSANEKIETELDVNAVLKRAGKSAASKKRKLSVDQVKTNEVAASAEKSLKLDSAIATTSSKEDRSEEVFETNILSSVGLVKRTPAPVQTFQQPAAIEKPTQTSPIVVQSKNSTCDTNQSNEGAARTRCDIPQRARSPIVLIPFVEIKKELENESNAMDTTSSAEQIQIPSSSSSLSQITNCTVSSNESSPTKNCSSNTTQGLNTNIKTENSSDDDSLMIIEDDIANNANTPAKLKSVIDQQLDNLRCGSISVRDINKMTSKDSHQMLPSNARKSFPKGPANASASILKPRNNTAANKSAPMNNMVCIPLEGLPRLDLNYNATQPPPLSVVGSGSTVSLLTQNQPQSVQTTVSSAPSTTLSNGPPPLSITSIPAITSVSSATSKNPITFTAISNGMLTEQMASAVTDQIVRRNPPPLTARPAAPLRSESDTAFPSEAGSVCKTLMENAHKMTDFFRSVIEDTLSDLANMSNPEAKIRLLEIELEKQKIVHTKEVADLKANTDRLLLEMKKSMDKERLKVINDTRRQCEMERIRSVEETKKKQWCANCFKEAEFYCCWNTSYCNELCQRKHWDQHRTICAQLDSAQNSRKSNARAASKPDARPAQAQPQPTQSPHLHATTQSLQQPKPQVSVQKDNSNLTGASRPPAPSGPRASNNPLVPALRHILPKNQGGRRANQQQSVQSQVKQAQNQQSCIILSRPLPNWPPSSSKPSSLLHSNAIFLPSSQPYTKLTNVQPSSSAGVSLLNASHAQGQKQVLSETIIIP